MNQNQDKGVKLSMLCVVLFALILLAMDLAVLVGLKEIITEDPAMTYINSGLYVLYSWRGISLLICFLLSSVFVWIALVQLYLLLRNLRQGDVFVGENVHRMRIVSRCCFGAAFIGMIAGFFCIHEDLAAYLPVLFCMTLAAAFIGLIVRIVKNSFEAAISMKEELNLTI